MEIINWILNKLNKQVLIWFVILFGGATLTLWLNYSPNSPKSIIEGQNKIMTFAVSQAKISNRNDSLQNIEINNQGDKINMLVSDNFLMRMQVDTVINQLTPAVVSRLKLMTEFYLRFNKSITETKENKNESSVPKSEPILNMTPIRPKYEQTLTLINDIDVAIASDTLKKKSRTKGTEYIQE